MAAKIGGGNHQSFLLYVSCIFCESAVENEVLLQKWRAKFLRDPSKTGFIAKSLLQTICVKGPNAKKLFCICGVTLRHDLDIRTNQNPDRKTSKLHKSRQETFSFETAEGIRQYGEGQLENAYSPWSQHEKSYANESCHGGGMNRWSVFESDFGTLTITVFL